MISRVIIIKQNNTEKEVFKFKNNYDLLNFLKRFSYILKYIQNFQKLDIHRSYNIFSNKKKHINNSNYDLFMLHWINSEMISIV